MFNSQVVVFSVCQAFSKMLCKYYLIKFLHSARQVILYPHYFRKRRPWKTTKWSEVNELEGIELDSSPGGVALEPTLCTARHQHAVLYMADAFCIVFPMGEMSLYMAVTPFALFLWWGKRPSHCLSMTPKQMVSALRPRHDSSRPCLYGILNVVDANKHVLI